MDTMNYALCFSPGGHRGDPRWAHSRVVDDEDRENEGDLTIAAEKVTPEIINFMAVRARPVCLGLRSAAIFCVCR